MWRFFSARVDALVPAAVTIALGAFITLQSGAYRMGTLQDMGPGYFPSLLGIIMCLLGLCLPFVAAPRTEGNGEGVRNLRGPLLIVAAILAFAMTVETLGLVPAVLAAVFLSSQATRGIPILSSLILAVLTATGSYVLFVGALKLQFQAYG